MLQATSFEMNITLSKLEVPLGAVLTCNLGNVHFEWGSKTTLALNESVSLSTSHSISRHIARLNPTVNLYPSNILHRTEVDHWLSLSCGPLGCKNDISSILNQLNGALAPSTFLTAGRLTIADLEIFAALYKCREWQQIWSGGSSSHVMRWYNHINSKVEHIISSLPSDVRLVLSKKDEKESSPSSFKRDEGGKFVELPDAKMGEVVVRFPPEASGFLHIGHAKAALLNQFYQKAFKGKLIMRFDDTNPEKEKADFEKVILEDLKLLDVEPDSFTHTSDHFDTMIGMCEDLLRSGKAYVDDTEAELMKKEREEKKDSKNRNNSVETNLKMWNEMKKGSDMGVKCCVRAKIDMNSPNGCMRDPTIYRCKNEPHVRTANKYKVYPTYDFACPIVDSIEGVTHALRTTEYHDRDEQYYWFIANLGLRSLHIYEYSRLNMNNTVLSKRKLTWFVNEGLVDSWDDPRFPTVRGIIRRGMTVEGLKDFIISQGSSRSVVNMEWDKIWSFNKKVIDREAVRYTALQGDLVPVSVLNSKEEKREAQKHPKDPSKGTKTVWVGPKIFIEAVDAEELKEGENATFINWGNLKILKVSRQDGKIINVDAETNLSNTDFKKTLKLTWLAETPKALWTPLVCVYFDHLINKSVLGKDEDFKDFIGHKTRYEVQMLGDDELKHLKEGDIIQLQRKGFFRVDEAFKPFSSASCKESPVVLFSIPDGHSKEMPGTNLVKKIAGMSLKECQQSAKGKLAEKSPQEEDKAVVTSDSASEIHSKIVKQGDKIRKLKFDKADKTVIVAEVEILKAFKTEFKELTTVEWKPEIDISQFTNPKTAPVVPEAKDNFKVLEVHNKIKEQGEKIRTLKGAKGDKQVIKQEVDILLSLKNEFKEVANIEWKPDIDISSVVSAKETCKESDQNSAVDISNKIKEQGDKIRVLKNDKADKGVIKSNVDILLSLKKDYKSITGNEWKPEAGLSQIQAPKDVAASKVKSCDDQKVLSIHSKIKDQGDQIRNLKSSKADKEVIKAEVDKLLALKKDFKNITNVEWKPDMDLNTIVTSAIPSKAGTDTEIPQINGALEVHNKIKEKGDKIRNLKTQKAEKDIIKAEVEELLSLKNDFKALTNIDWKPDIDPSSFEASGSNPKSVIEKATKSVPEKASKSVPEKPSKLNKESKPVKVEPNMDESAAKKQTRLGLEAKKEENLSDWYSQVITKSEMIEYYNVSGCYILRPWSYAIWDFIKDFFDHEIKKLGVENSYFPMFVSKEALEKEKTHIADFSPEVAWVTRSGSSEMAEPVAIRPTSETVMYPAFAKWIQSHRDLPMKLNQWNNVVRWEFKQPTPFLRTREFLWQEGHTAFATKEEACTEVYAILDLYARVYEELLAIPVVKGKKTNKEKFAGGDFTTTTEAFVSASGRAIQGATSHHLGQNFSKMFDIVFEDPKTKEKQYVFQNSWGLTTRTIGVMVMVHGDNKGLVLPPRVATIQVVIMPVGVTAKTSDDEKEALIKSCTELESQLIAANIRTRCDFRDNITPAWKFNHWEVKGVPLRLELGPREVAASQVFAVRRDNGEKQTLSRANVASLITNILEAIQKNLFERAKADLDSHKIVAKDWAGLVGNLEKGNVILVPFCGEEDCEDSIKKDSARDEPSEPGAPSMGAKGLCIPFEQPGSVVGLKCIHPKCSKGAQFYTLFGRSY